MSRDTPLNLHAAQALTTLIDVQHLHLVDWCSRIEVLAQEQAVRAYLTATY